MASSELVTFRGGFVADVAVVVRLLSLEGRGARFELHPNGRFRVVPASAMGPEDVAFLREHRDEARRVLEYQADDSHLFSDLTIAQDLKLPGRGGQERVA
jgi:hypothetical protein